MARVFGEERLTLSIKAAVPGERMLPGRLEAPWLSLMVKMLGMENEIDNMNIKYFNDTDTALVEFSDNAVKETQEISKNIHIDIDADGNLVSITIEHAGKTAHLPDISYQQIDNAVAA